mgnify:CR=1 FL=1
MMSNQLPEAPQLDTVNAPANVPLLIGIVPDDPISEAARKILRFQFDFMLAREAAVRTTNDHDAIQYAGGGAADALCHSAFWWVL